MDEGLLQIVDEIEEVALDASRRLPPEILGQVLAFLTKVSLVLEQAYRDIIPILIDVKYLDERTLSGPQFVTIMKNIDLVLSTSHYRDAEEICSRLKTLKNTYLNDLAQHISPDEKYQWSGLLGLIEEREGRIVQLISHQLFQIKDALNDASAVNLPAVRKMASDQIVEVQKSLRELNSFTSRILGLSGSAGLLEMLRDPSGTPTATRELSLMIDRRQVIRDQHNYSTTGSQSPIYGAGMQTGNINNEWSAPQIDLPHLARELEILRMAMKSEATGEPDEDIALGEIAKAEAAAKSGDQTKALQALKSAGRWAFSVAEKIGVGVAIAAMKPLIGG
ncbi:hypothetical protein [Rhizobium leguminosarum]|uniref:Uncharacterized protein n=1 Tax=Rhizobium leguminosarum TaxID=384 RepID=A0A7K3VLM8_RHILE|nr:hypothetical protein [Rhizobium leguminosarum]NEK17478.1 hypothetical protein [Rhizobium leguminosarum]